MIHFRLVFFPSVNGSIPCTGWIVVRNAVLAELSDTAEAIGVLDQSYAFSGTNSTTSSFTAGSNYADAPDNPPFPDTGVGDAALRGSITVNIPAPAFGE